jgi:hypothetical protein
LPRGVPNDLGAEANRIRAKRRSTGIKQITAKVERGEATGNERAMVRVGAANTRIITGQDDLSDWSDEELQRGMRRDKNGKWRGVAPKIIPKKLHDELVRRTLINANELMRDNLEEAVRELVAIATSEAYEAKDRLRAISMIMDRVMGKPADKVEISGQSPWLVALQGGIISVNGAGAVPEEPDEEDDIDEADWEDDSSG